MLVPLHVYVATLVFCFRGVNKELTPLGIVR